MSYNVNKESGYASRQSWMQLNNSDVVEVSGQEGSNNTGIYDRKYAQLTYQVNATPVSISGGLSATITSVGLSDAGTVKLSGDALKVSDQAVVDAVNNITVTTSDYSQLIRVDGSSTYIMKATPGAISGSANWQIQRITEVGTSVDIEWADGNTNFDNIASGYLSLSYSL